MVSPHNRFTFVLLAGTALTCGLLSGQPVSGLRAQDATEKTADKSKKAVAPTEAPASAADPRAADRAAIRKTMQSFAEAFQKSDPVVAGSFMTPGAELIAADGAVIRGREAIQAGYARHFAKNARPKLSLAVKSLDFPSRDTAIEEGLMTIAVGEGEDAESTTNNYSILYVREDGKWYLASIREWTQEQSPLEELEWLIGTWSAKGKESDAETTYEWFGNKSFIKASFSIREKSTAVTGMQLIGIDHETNTLRTWTFEADGGYGEGTVVRDGNKWIFETSTALTDRRVMTASNILIHINKNTFTWQPIDLTIDGEQIANLPPVKVVRVEAKK